MNPQRNDCPGRVVMRSIAMAMALATARSNSWADCAPKHLVKMVVIDASPSVRTGSLAARPKTVYRLGRRFLRVEVAADIEHHIHGLIISAEPDNWIVNLADGTGRHVVDRDAAGVVRAPLFHVIDAVIVPEALRGIEFGCEVAFFGRYGSPVEPVRQSGGRLYRQAVAADGWTAALLRQSRDGPPGAVVLFHGDAIASAFTYISYEERLGPPDLGLFEKPRGVTFAEDGGR